MKYLTYIVISLLFLSPFLLSNRFSFLSNFVVLLSVLLLIIANRFEKGILFSKTNILLFIFFVASILFLPFSLLPIRSIANVIWLLGYIGIFVYIQNLVTNENILKNISKLFVIFTAVFGIYSLISFVETGLTAYPRLIGIIGNHNVYGGFLIIPFLLSIFLIITERGKWQRLVWYLSGAVILASLVLTFSRGTWLSIVLAVIISAIFFGNKIWSNYKINDFKQVVRSLIILIFLSLAVFSTVWYMAKNTTIKGDSKIADELTIYPQQDLEVNAVTARLAYFQDAWKTFLRSPLTGFGQGMYVQALRMYKSDPMFGSFADPHNWLLKNLVENGIFVTAILVVFLVLLFREIASLIIRKKDISWLSITIFTALVGGTIHGLMDFDWSINLVLLVFFVFAGALYGYLQNGQELRTRYFPKWFNYMFLFIIVVISFISLQTLRADIARAKGDIYFANKDSETAINSYFESITYNSYDPASWYSLWKVYFTRGQYGPAKNCIDKALEIFPESGIYWGAKARTEEALGNSDDYRQSLLKAIKYFPASDLSYYVKLVEFDFKQKKYDEALSYINKAEPVYSRYEKSLWYKNDPNSTLMSENLAILKDYKKKIVDLNK